MSPMNKSIINQLSNSLSVKIATNSEFRDNLMRLGVGFSDPCSGLGGPDTVKPKTVVPHILCYIKDSFNQQLAQYRSHW